MGFKLVHSSRKTSSIAFRIRKQKYGHVINTEYSTGISIPVKCWDSERQRISPTTIVPYRKYNTILDDIEEEVFELFENNAITELTAAKILRKIDQRLGRTKKVEKKRVLTFGQYLAKFIAEKKEEAKGLPSRDKKHRYYKKFVTLKNKLPYNRLDWEDFDIDWYKKFIKLMEKQDCAQGYIGALIKDLKTVLKNGWIDKHHANIDFMNFKVLKEKVFKPYLSEEELEIMYNLPLAGYLDNARDLFLIGAFTGMRAGNYLNLDPDINIDRKNEVINFIMNKGGGRMQIPLHWIISELIKKYNGGLPHSISDVCLNRYIKEVAKKAGFTERIIFTQTKGGVLKTLIKEKWELITSHTARRSLATNLYLNGASLTFIMSVTGHTTEKNCMLYIKCGLNDVLPKVKQMGFWKKKKGKAIRMNVS